MAAMGSSFAHGSGHYLPKPQLYLAERTKERPWDKHARISQATRLVAAAAQPVVFASLTISRSARSPDVPRDAESSGKTARFDALLKQAALASGKLAGHFERPGSTESPRPPAKIDAPASGAIGPLPAKSTDKPLPLLAYAAHTQSGTTGAAFSALLEDNLAASQDPNMDGDDVLPGYEDTPSSGPLPQFRPRGDQAQKRAAETEEPEDRQTQDGAEPKAEQTGKADERETPKKQKLAYARPDDPAESSSGSGFGQALRNIFGSGARAGNGVAVYDITAAKVYMPDGSVLEAHSGIGKMADNPRYVNVRMTGPTPPHTYNLRMRETRFHGVEAIRMLPVDGKNKHGRDGFLTHSYLLRGNRAESHGCVAFKDYPRFLAAFKQGKVKQIVVVPSGGRAAGTRLASNGRSS
ncbi:MULTISPECIES: DUF2778 domain-containing protein [unclassified Sinorhizobium]|uniref:DUF2778 domain-containing protein n=1 Tax=unclassified Sinorhizobium TaxID=2613772 RepID=UPI0024C2124B|nr:MULTISPECIES: DUF2778 domain-containing protein [unclassified Sinorhizobium]MDK1377864.1 DUF2778 domain-containing protein [Sinorhizobium sp. 6-70]MDK1479861.1 DUF2778 domain-containing protein [Sinorhizobium sp. 6-117]